MITERVDSAIPGDVSAHPPGAPVLVLRIGRWGFGVWVMAALTLALGLLYAMEPRPAYGTMVVSNRDYTLVTAGIQRGGDGLYVLDNRTNLIAFFTWNPQRRALDVRDVRPMVELLSVDPAAR